MDHLLGFCVKYKTIRYMLQARCNQLIPIATSWLCSWFLLLVASSWLTERPRFISTISWQRHPLRFGLGYIVAKQMVFNLSVQGHSLITPINVEFHPLVLVSELTLGYNTGVAVCYTFLTMPSPCLGATTLTDYEPCLFTGLINYL